MYFVTAQPTTTARNITRSAQQQIREKTGMRIHLMAPLENMGKSPQRMLHVIALALDMNPLCFTMKTRVRNIVEMRYLAAMLLRQNYPALTLQQIAKLFGLRDHTTIMSGLQRAYNLIQTADPRFLKKYNTALQSVSIWLRKGE